MCVKESVKKRELRLWSIDLYRQPSPRNEVVSERDDPRITTNCVRVFRVIRGSFEAAFCYCIDI